MKRGKELVFAILLLIVFSLSIIQSVDSQGLETEILTPNLTVSGTLRSTHLSDYYRIAISQPGVYIIELNSTGSSRLEASFNRFSYGYPSTIRRCYSNTSYCFTIVASSRYYGSFYQLDVSFAENSVADLTDYIVSIQRVEPIAIEEGIEYTLQQDAYIDSHYILDVSGSYRTYRVIASSSYYCYFAFYDSYGLWINREQCSDSYSIDEIIMFDPGIYHLFIDAGSSNGQDITFQITPEDIPTLELDSSIQVDFEGISSNVYVQLPLTEGTQYSIELAPHSLIDVSFDIMRNPDFRITINAWPEGYTESLVDFVFWDNYMAYTDWDTNPEMQVTRSRPKIKTFYSSSYNLPHSGLLLRAYSSVEGSATIRLNKVEDVQALSTDSPVAAQFDGIDGPFWKLYKLDNFAGGELYNFQLTHTPANDCILNPYYRISTPEITDQNYLSRIRPLLSEIEKPIWDNLPGTYTYLQYDNIIPNSNAFYYHPITCESWLYVSIPDGYYYDHYSYDSIHSGSMELEVHRVEPIIQTMDSQFTMDPSLDTSIYSLQLDGNCIYEITVTGSNYQSHVSVSLWNGTGHRLPSLYYGVSAQTDKNIRHYQFEVKCDGEHHLLVTAFGELPLTITITKMTDSSPGVQYPFFIGGLAVAVVEGIIIGIVIGKVKFGKGDG